MDRTLGVTEGEEDGPKVHLECWEAYEAKIAADREAKEAAKDPEPPAA